MTGRPAQIDRTREHWKAWQERACRGCGNIFQPEARAELYCKACSAAGKGWAGRKGKREADDRERAAQVRQRGYPWDVNVLVGRARSASTFKPLGDLSASELERVAARHVARGRVAFGSLREAELSRAASFKVLAAAVVRFGVGTMGELPVGWRDTGRDSDEERRAA
jgi:hypothetical protein